MYDEVVVGCWYCWGCDFFDECFVLYVVVDEIVCCDYFEFVVFGVCCEVGYVGYGVVFVYDFVDYCSWVKVGEDCEID